MTKKSDEDPFKSYKEAYVEEECLVRMRMV
jgi:hypothetical protein